MHWKSLLLGAAIAAAAFTTAGRVFSGDDKPPEGGPTPEQLKLVQPGPEHAALKQYEGSWDGKGTWQGAEWTSHQTGKMIMGDRFLQMEEVITVPTPGGPMVIHSLGFVGYDNLQKKYIHMAVGDDTTSFASDEGQHDAARKLNEMRGVEHRPGKDVKYRATFTDVTDGTFHAEMFFDEGTGEQKMMIGDYKKK